MLPSKEKEVYPRFKLHPLWILLFILLTFVLSIFWDALRQHTFLYTLQELRGSLFDAVFRAFTFLGDDEFFLLFIPVIYWTANKALGIKVAVVLMLSAIYTFILKDITRLPRPSIGVHSLTDYAFPSGHTLTAVTVWGYLAYQLRNRFTTLAVMFIILMIGFSRLYLAYHFPGDIFGGLIFGGLFLLLFIYAEEHLFTRISLSFPALLVLSIALPALLSTISPRPDYIKVWAFLSGSLAGYLIETEHINARREALPWQQIMKCAIGLSILFGIVMGLGLLFPASSSFLRFVRYALAGIWITLLWPWCFMKLKLYTA